MNRDYRPVEARLLSEWLAVRHADDRCLQRVRVGSLHPSLVETGLDTGELRLLGVWRRWVDAVIIGEREVTLVEAAVFPDPGDVAQLELYLRLWPSTPEYQDYVALPVRGLSVTYYRPVWVDSYLATLAARRRRAPLTSL
jgi:hypothetical protein